MEISEAVEMSKTVYGRFGMTDKNLDWYINLRNYRSLKKEVKNSLKKLNKKYSYKPQPRLKSDYHFHSFYN